MPCLQARRAIVAATLGVPAILAAPAGAGAQRITSTLDVGGTRMHYADTLAATAATVSPALRLDWTRLSVSTMASGATFAGGEWSTQASIAASGFTRHVGRFRGELATSLGGSAHKDNTRTGQMVTNARLYASGSWVGGWAGLGAGRMWDGLIWRNVRQDEAGAWVANATTSLLAFATPTRVDDSLQYTDTQLVLQTQHRALEVAATGGIRTGSHLPDLGGTARRWGSVSATHWLSRTKALVLSAGAYPVDLTQGFPGGRYLSLSARYQPGHMGATAPDAVGDSIAAAARASGIRDFQVQRVAEHRVIRVRAPAAASVEVRGDFTSWDAVALTRGSDGWWSMTGPAEPGTYQMNVRADGHGWTVPPGLVVLTDEFGGRAGVVAIEK